MATVTSTLRLNDQMTGVLKNITRAMDSTLRVMEHTDVASSSAFKSAKKDAKLAAQSVDEFGKSFDGVPPHAKKAEKSLSDLVSKAISLTAIVYGIRTAFMAIGKVTNISDSMTQSTARLNIINDGLQTTVELQDQIFASANRARASYQDTVDAVGQLGMNAGDVFSSTKEIIAFSELMNKSFKVSGADAQAQAGAMRQLTQAMASGVLRGDEFNSIAEQAPMVYDAIAKYMGKSKGEVRALASEGEITAGIVKAAMFAAQDDIEGKFADMPKTWSEHWTIMKNNALKAFRPVLEKVNQLANSEKFQMFISKITNSLAVLAIHALNFIGAVGNMASFLYAHLDKLPPILAGIGIAFVLLQSASIAAAIQSSIAWVAATWPLLLLIGLIAGLVIAYQNSEGALQALIAIIGIVVLAIGAWVAIQWVLNTAMAANPIGAVIMVIVILIGVIIAVIAWVRNLLKTNLDFKYGIFNIWDSIMNFFKKVPLFFQWVGNGIADAFAWAKVSVLSILQSMANGAIDIINSLINTLNMIPGVAIDPIEHLTFAASAAAEEEAKKQARDGDLVASEALLKAEAAAGKETRTAQRAAEQSLLDSKERHAVKVEMEARAAAAASSKGADYSEFGGAAGAAGAGGDIGRVGSVGKIEDEVSISDEDIKMLRDIASMEYQLHYTQLTPSFTAQFGDVHETADVEGAIDTLLSEGREALNSRLVVAP